MYALYVKCIIYDLYVHITHPPFFLWMMDCLWLNTYKPIPIHRFQSWPMFLQFPTTECKFPAPPTHTFCNSPKCPLESCSSGVYFPQKKDLGGHFGLLFERRDVKTHALKIKEKTIRTNQYTGVICVSLYNEYHAWTSSLLLCSSSCRIYMPGQAWTSSQIQMWKCICKSIIIVSSFR